MAEEFDPSTKVNKRVIGEYTSRTEKGRKENKDNDARWKRVWDAENTNYGEKGLSKMLKTQVTPGVWKTKDKL